uniref:Uncharacterized protein n=1 Tax=Poecilia reticulata TaxID=8081 RepID=A0A3P9PWN9_POERE
LCIPSDWHLLVSCSSIICVCVWGCVRVCVNSNQALFYRRLEGPVHTAGALFTGFSCPLYPKERRGWTLFTKIVYKTTKFGNNLRGVYAIATLPNTLSSFF